MLNKHKRIVAIIGNLILLGLIFYCGYQALLILKIDNPLVEGCDVQTDVIITITKGVLEENSFTDNQKSYYYINRVLNRGLNLDTLHTKVFK